MWKIIVLGFVVFGSSLSVEEEQVWDYLVFTQRWQSGSCEAWQLENSSNSCYIPTYYTWTIHGLWPSNQTGAEPEACTDEPLELKNIVPILSDLLNYWPDVWVLTGDFVNDSLTFWEHEWDKHGTCGVTLNFLDSQEKYFEFTLDLHKKYDIYEILQNDSIIPCSFCSYDFEKINSTLIQAIGKIPSIRCTKKNSLQEVGICFDKEMNMIDCTKYPTSCNVTEPIYYPIILP